MQMLSGYKKDSFHPIIATWWRSIDIWLLFCVVILLILGLLLIVAASPSITLQHHWSTFVLLKKHIFILIPSFFILILGSFWGQKFHVRMARFVMILSLLGVIFSLFWGAEIKGARRWISLGSFSLQPSEFLKPALSVITADILARFLLNQPSEGFIRTLLVLGICITPLFFQPDLGMIFILGALWLGQVFIAGLNWRWLVVLGVIFLVSIVGIYFCFPHAAVRVQSFLGNTPASADAFGAQYQVLQALKGFAAGGLWGKGPGAGTVLDRLPDSHADFIFAVAGEEMGLVMCLIIWSLYVILIFKGIKFVFKEQSLFYALATLGLTLQLALQVILNMGSVLKLIPTKGVTLPFVSYGGSSLLSLCWGMSMLLSFTRRYQT
jgi:cell division protein FtsW